MARDHRGKSDFKSYAKINTTYGRRNAVIEKRHQPSPHAPRPGIGVFKLRNRRDNNYIMGPFMCRKKLL